MGSRLYSWAARALAALLLLWAAGAQAQSEVTAATPGLVDEPALADLALGQRVVEEKCLSCHAKGLLGAPVVGNREAWEKRIAQGTTVLAQHAIAGHGNMPPRGGFELTDEEVAAAVAYLVHEGRKIVEQAPEVEAAAAECAPRTRNLDCTDPQMRKLLILQMLWLLSQGREGGAR
jgi:cytochrome c5